MRCPSATVRIEEANSLRPSLISDRSPQLGVARETTVCESHASGSVPLARGQSSVSSYVTLFTGYMSVPSRQSGEDVMDRVFLPGLRERGFVEGKNGTPGRDYPTVEPAFAR